MNKTYLLTRPEHDDTTYYLSNWCKETITSAKERGFRVIDLNRERANKKEFIGIIKKITSGLVVFNGHGNENTVTGHNNEPILSSGENEECLKSKIIYAISCRSAKNLGPKSIEAGAISYVGYVDDFIFFYEPENFSRPLQDTTAKMFLEPSNLFIVSLLKGNSVIESHKRAKTLIKGTILKLLSSTGQDNSLARYLWWDLKNFEAHGSVDATL